MNIPIIYFKNGKIIQCNQSVKDIIRQYPNGLILFKFIKLKDQFLIHFLGVYTTCRTLNKRKIISLDSHYSRLCIYLFIF